jgi:hypothetical protein
MRLDQCLACQSLDLYHSDSAGDGGLLLRPTKLFWVGPFRAVLTKCVVCLSCGFVAPYIAEGDRERVRSWKAKEKAKRNATATVDER